MNPCPCGYFGDAKRECRCSPNQVERYRERISGPLLDRIDIHLEVPAVPYREMASNEPGESSQAIRARVERARDIQRDRFGSKHKVRCNARMSAKLIKTHCALDEQGESLLQMAMTQLNFSARAYDRILKVARTIADLAGEKQIRGDHVSEAIQYRTLDRTLWA
jgi:magnesium chelatase family protein